MELSTSLQNVFELLNVIFRPVREVDEVKKVSPAGPRDAEDFSALKGPNGLFHMTHDGVVHNPLGAGSYVFETQHIKPVLRQLGLIPPEAKFPPQSASGWSGIAGASVDSRDASADARHLTFPPSDSGISLSPSSGLEPAFKGPETTIYVHIGVQPNNSPHVGTIIVFAQAFLFARSLQNTYSTLYAFALSAGHDMSSWAGPSVRAVVQLDVVDTAPDNARTQVINGVVYQRSHRSTGAMQSFLPDYYHLLAALTQYVEGEVGYVVKYQDELMRSPRMRDALSAIVRDRAHLAVELAPDRECLAIRAACPVEGCGMADKHGVRNTYHIKENEDGEGSTTIVFQCAVHGSYAIRLEDPSELARIELNTPSRNLARGLVYMADTAASRPSEPSEQKESAPRRVHMRVTGADYAGVYQEQLFYRQLPSLAKNMGVDLERNFPYVSYSPLIVDWSGAKLSKSLYVRKNAYAYLQRTDSSSSSSPGVGAGLGFLLEYRKMVEEGRDVTILFRMVEGWLNEPKKLHGRVYTVEYLRLVFLAAERKMTGQITSTLFSNQSRLRSVIHALGLAASSSGCTALPWVMLGLMLGYTVSRF